MRTDITRRRLVQAGATLAGTAMSPLPSAWAAGLPLPSALPQGLRDNATMEALPGKKPLIKLAYRPPNYEAPITYLRTPITPNDEFFVRYHLANIPRSSTPRPGKSRSPAMAPTAPPSSLSMISSACRQPRSRPCASAPATGAACSIHTCPARMGLRRHGMRAPWKGVRLKDVLARVGLKKEAIEIAFDAADSPVGASKTPDFIKKHSGLENRSRIRR